MQVPQFPKFLHYNSTVGCSAPPGSGRSPALLLPVASGIISGIDLGEEGFGDALDLLLLVGIFDLG